MDISGLNAAFGMIVGVLSLVGVANLLDFKCRTMAEEKAQRAESIRFRKWGLPAPKTVEPPRNDDHLWHF